MNSRTWILGGVVAACALGATVWIFGSGQSTTGTEAALPVEGDKPKARVHDPEYDFGVMAVHETASHVFVIENVGEMPLSLEQGATTCKCTLSNLEKGLLAPGEKAEIELEWTAKERTKSFQQKAKILTNDPYRAAITLIVRGRIETVVQIEPSGTWEFGQVKNHMQADLTGVMYSTILDDFRIHSIEGSDPVLVAEFGPMEDSVRERLQAKSGYAIRARLAGEIPIGRFQEWLTIETDIEGALPDGRRLREGIGMTLRVSINGLRQGPMSVLGPGWSNTDMTLRMGAIQASAGKRATLSMFLTDLDDVGDFNINDFEVEEITSTLSFLNVTVEKDPNFKADGRKKLDIHVEVPPGSPPYEATGDAVAKVKFRTNHPSAKEYEMSVKFVSR